MDRKTLTAIALGALAAGILCCLAGIIVYFTANTAQNMLIGLFMIFAGCAMAALTLIVLLVILIVYLAQKSKK